VLPKANVFDNAEKRTKKWKKEEEEDEMEDDYEFGDYGSESRTSLRNAPVPRNTRNRKRCSRHSRRNSTLANLF
jgi:hypothetical protein